jgi:hypothetical protein
LSYVSELRSEDDADRSLKVSDLAEGDTAIRVEEQRLEMFEKWGRKLAQKRGPRKQEKRQGGLFGGAHG